MSDSIDARRCGHRRYSHPGKEYWSARPGKNVCMADWGRPGVKRETHRAERRISRAEARAIREAAEVASVYGAFWGAYVNDLDGLSEYEPIVERLF